MPVVAPPPVFAALFSLIWPLASLQCVAADTLAPAEPEPMLPPDCDCATANEVAPRTTVVASRTDFIVMELTPWVLPRTEVKHLRRASFRVPENESFA